jgi:hypothetical protein
MKGKLKSLVEKVVEKNVANHSQIKERVGDLCHYTVLSDMRALINNDCIIANYKKEDN